MSSAIALFRRKVRNVIICEATAYDILHEVDPNSETLRTSFQNIYCLFGQASEVGQPRDFNKVLYRNEIYIFLYVCMYIFSRL